MIKLKLTEQQREELEDEKVRLQNEIIQLEKEAEYSVSLQRMKRKDWKNLQGSMTFCQK